MPIEICNALGPNCFPDWNGVAAAATASATVVALFVPFWLRRDDQRQRREALGHSLLLKMVKIHSDIFKLWQHVSEQRALAKEHGAKPDTWPFFRPLASTPDPIRFSSDELALLLSLKNNDVFNDVLSMDEVHRANFANLDVYSRRREELTQSLPGGNMTGTVGSIDLNQEQFLRFGPMAAQLDMLVKDMVVNIERHSRLSKSAMEGLNTVLRKKLKLKIEVIMLDGETE